MLARFRKGRKAPDLDSLTRRIILPSLPVADEDVARLELWEQGRALARQDRWSELAAQINTADDARLSTRGGASEAGLLAEGAQSDIVAAAQDALADGQPPCPDGIAAMEEALIDAPRCHATAMVLALAHMNIGRAWIAADPTQLQHPSEHHAHFRRAEGLLAPFDSTELDAPSLAAVQCALTELMSPVCGRIVTGYRKLLALDPHCPAYLRSFGQACLQADPEDLALLEQEARDMVGRTQAIWGRGAYVWVYLDTLTQGREALEALDVAYFIDGLRDILKTRPDQHIINELAAFCAMTMAPVAEEPRALARAKAELHGCVDWILAEYLQELHPLVWAKASQEATGPLASAGPSRAQVAQGRKTALRVIAQRFADQLADGSSIAFSPAGMYRLPAM